MKRLASAFLVAALAAPASFLATADHRLPDFRARYMLKKAGLNVVRATVSLKRQGRSIAYRSVAEPIGLASWFFGDHRIYEQSRLAQLEPKVRPLEYRYRHVGSDENRNEHYRYEWRRKLARVFSRGERKTLQIPDRTLDTFSVQLALIQDADKAAKRIAYPVISRGELKRYTFTKLGRETVEIPLGDFETIVLERRKDDDEHTTYTTWHAPDLHYLPVKLENREDGDVVLSLILEEVEWR